MVPRRYVVIDSWSEVPDTVTLRLMPVDTPIAPARPGQFVMLWVFGVGEIPISYSGGCGSRSEIVHTIRGVSEVSKALAALRPGMMVGVRGPFGSWWDVDVARDRDVLIVAGGIGLAPVRPVIEHVLTNRDSYRDVSIMVGHRSPATLLFAEDLRSWRSRFDVSAAVTVDLGDRSWHGPVGVVTDLFPDRLPDPDATVAFVCGPEVMMRHVAIRLIDLGVTADRIQVSLERNMKCAIAQCGHCQFGEVLVCRDGPVIPYTQAAPLFTVREL